MWIGYFVFARLFFLLFYVERTKEIGLVNFFKTFAYGLQLDLAFTGYLCLIPFLLIIFSIFFNKKKIRFFIKIYTILVLVIINFLLIIDAGLYQTWGVRLDTTLLAYINTPEVMIASVSTFQFILGSIFFVIISFVFIKWFLKVITKRIEKVTIGNWLQVPLFLLMTIALIIPIRGGFQTIPVNQSNVYFSDKMFANHASINFIWNFFNTLTHKTDGKNPYKKFDDTVAQNIIDKNRNPLLVASKDSILNTEKPNIILLIWEGLPAKLVAPLGGELHVTENLNKLSKEGILFTNFYANGDRTDKGIPAVTLISPLNNVTDQPRDVVLRWNKNSDATSYRIELSYDEDFLGVFRNSSNVAATNYSDLANGTTYYWRVKTISNSLTSPWSEVWNFTVEQKPNSIAKSLGDKITVYPNPSNDIIQISGVADVNTKIEVINSLGQIVNAPTLNGKHIGIDVKDLTSGVYTLKIYMGESVVRKTIVVSH